MVPSFFIKNSPLSCPHFLYQKTALQAWLEKKGFGIFSSLPSVEKSADEEPDLMIRQAVRIVASVLREGGEASWVVFFLQLFPHFFLSSHFFPPKQKHFHCEAHSNILVPQRLGFPPLANDRNQRPTQHGSCWKWHITGMATTLGVSVEGFFLFLVVRVFLSCFPFLVESWELDGFLELLIWAFIPYAFHSTFFVLLLLRRRTRPFWWFGSVICHWHHQLCETPALL